jgi:hypothetical protein
MVSKNSRLWAYDIGSLPIMPSTPACPRMNPKRKNMRMLSTFKHVGTKTPENVPSFSWPPTGRGHRPGLEIEGSSFFHPSALWRWWCINSWSLESCPAKGPLIAATERSRKVDGDWKPSLSSLACSVRLENEPREGIDCEL